MSKTNERISEGVDRLGEITVSLIILFPQYPSILFHFIGSNHLAFQGSLHQESELLETILGSSALISPSKYHPAPNYDWAQIVALYQNWCLTLT